DEGRGLYAEDKARTVFSEHSQCLALLADAVPAARRARVARGLLDDPALARTTIYYSHYLFETLRLLGRVDRMIERMGLWFSLEELGAKTTIEMPEPSRSDCHAWGAHPLYHYAATILGVRPAGFGFAAVEIAPLLGPLSWARGAVPHPRGDIRVELVRNGAKLDAIVSLPEGLAGVLVSGGARQPLRAGENRLSVPASDAIALTG
ncbi:MAG: alpha-L-rhamnosidase, partial [Planctomycetes bacterium]|nr:alpha-L-rhamnosidase [Planctomycetota bacterium]